MQIIRDRAKQSMPMVILTLLSIVQALALEFLWSHVREADYLFTMTWDAVLAWGQVLVNFIGIALIWVVYTSNTMRFRWIPSVSDSMYPFVVGLLEFMLIELTGPGTIGEWLIGFSLLVGLMTWVAHHSMRRARLNPENDPYFRNFERATLKDFYPVIGMMSGLVILGLVVAMSEGGDFLALVAVIAPIVFLTRQFIVTARFWDRSVSEETDLT